MSQSSRGKSSDKIANSSYLNSSLIQNNSSSNHFIVNHGQFHNQNSSSQHNNNQSYNSIREVKENQQKDLITEMKRLKKNFQELKSPTIQKKYFGVTGGQSQQQQSSIGSTQISTGIEQSEQIPHYNISNSSSYISNDQFNSNQILMQQHQQNTQNDSYRQSSLSRGNNNNSLSMYSHSMTQNHPPKGQSSDSNRNHYISQEDDGEVEQYNVTQIGQAGNNSINQSFNNSHAIYTKTMPPLYQLGSESNRSQNGAGNVNSSTLNQGNNSINQQRVNQKEYPNALHSQQQQLQSRQNNSLKRISDKINNIRDRAEKIEQIKIIEKKSQQSQQSSQILQCGGSSIIYQKKESKDCQTDDIANIFVEKQINDDNLKEVERLREQLKSLQNELNLKEHTLREQEKQLQTQLDEKQVRISEQDVQIEKAMDDLNRLQKENIKVNQALKQAQENLALNGKNQNNTSSQHLLPSEFKSKWESLVTDGVANTFINFFENPLILTNLLQDLFIIIHEVSKTHIKETNSKVMDLLQLDKKHSKVYEQNLSKLYQDFNNDIFKIIAESSNQKMTVILDKFKQQTDRVITHQYYSEFQNMKSDYIDEDDAEEEGENENNNTESNEEKKPSKKISQFRDTTFFEVNQEDFKQYLEELYESSEVLEFIEQFYRLSIHMHLHDPPLSLQVQNFKNRVFEYIPYKKNNFYLIDGFVSQNAPALIVIPPVMRNNQIYTGIKPSVILLTEDFTNDRIQTKIDQIIQKEQSQYNSSNNKNNNASSSKNNNNSGNKTDSKPNSSNTLQENTSNKKQESPKILSEKEKSIQNTMNQEQSTINQSNKGKQIINDENKMGQITTDFNSTFSGKGTQSIFRGEQKLEEAESIKKQQQTLRQSSDKKQSDSLKGSRILSKDNKENQEQYINQAHLMTSPPQKSINNVKNFSLVTQKLDSSTKKSGYLNFAGSIQTSPKQDLLNMISPKLDSSSKKINKDTLLNYSKNGSKLYENLSASSKKRLNFETSHSEKKNLQLNLNKSGLSSPNNLDGGKGDIVKNLFLTSRPHHSNSYKQKEDFPNTTSNQFALNISKGQSINQNRSEMDRKLNFEDLTNTPQITSNVIQSISQQSSKFINCLDGNKNMSFLKKGPYSGKSKISVSSHSNTTLLSNMIHKQTTDSVSLLRTLQVDNNQKTKRQNKDSCDFGLEKEEEQFEERSPISQMRSKNTSIDKQYAQKENPSPLSSKNNKTLNDSKSTFSNAVTNNNNDQDRSGIHSNNQSTQKLRRSNRSEDESRIINQNTIFNKHYKKNSIQTDMMKNMNLPTSSQQSSVSNTKPYTFNTFLENHRRNIQKTDKDSSQNYRQDSSSSSRDRIQQKVGNGPQKEQLNKSSINSSRLYKKDSFEQKSMSYNQNSNSNLQSFSKSPIDIKTVETKKQKNDDFYANLRRQINGTSINNQQQSGAGHPYGTNLENNNYPATKDSKQLALKSSRDISPSQIQLNSSKTDRIMKYSDHSTSNIGNYLPADAIIHPNSIKPSNTRTFQMKRALQNIIDSFSSDDDEEDEQQQQQISQLQNRKQRDSECIEDDSLIEELRQQRENSNVSRQMNQSNRSTLKNESNENRPFSFQQNNITLQSQNKKNKTFEKLYNDLKQKKSITQNPVKANKEYLSKI